MANEANKFISNNIEYSVLRNPEYFYQSLKKAHTLANDYIRVIPNVTKDIYVKKLAGTGSVSQVDGRNCAWDPTSGATLDGTTMSVKNFKINIEQCLEDLDSVYSEQAYSTIGATKDKFPQAEAGAQGLEDALMFVIQNELSNDIERLIWGGNGNAVAGVQDGIVDKALADADTIKIAGQTIDATNVIGEIQKVYDAIPDAVLNEGEFEPEKAPVKIFVDMTTMRYLKQALSTTPTAYQVILPSFAIEGGKVFYMGVEVVTVGLPKGFMVAASKDNLVFLTDLLSDTQAIRAQMGNDLYDEAKWYVKGAYRANAGYIFGNELVVYSR